MNVNDPAFDVGRRYRCSCCGGVRFPLRKRVAVCFRCDLISEWPLVLLVERDGVKRLETDR